jgi:hypothetical protein
MQETPQEREARMRDLAQRLLFKVEKANRRFTLIRTADVRGLVKKGFDLIHRASTGVSSDGPTG